MIDPSSCVRVEGIKGTFRTDQWSVVGTVLGGARTILRTYPLRPTQKDMEGHRKAFPRGVTLYYCDRAGAVEMIGE